MNTCTAWDAVWQCLNSGTVTARSAARGRPCSVCACACGRTCAGLRGASPTVGASSTCRGTPSLGRGEEGVCIQCTQLRRGTAQPRDSSVVSLLSYGTAWLEPGRAPSRLDSSAPALPAPRSDRDTASWVGVSWEQEPSISVGREVGALS